MYFMIIKQQVLTDCSDWTVGESSCLIDLIQSYWSYRFQMAQPDVLHSTYSTHWYVDIFQFESLP